MRPPSAKTRTHRLSNFIVQHRAAAIRFVAATGFSVSLNFGGTWFLHEFCGIGAKGAFAIVLAIGYICNFIIFRFWVFTAKETSPVLQMFQYLSTALCFRCCEYASFYMLFKVFRLNYLVAIFISLILFYGLKFFAYRFFIFKK